MPDASRPRFERPVRSGKTDADFRTSYFVLLVREYKLDVSAECRGFHVGGGYAIDFGGFAGLLDLSAGYFRTRRDGFSAGMSLRNAS
ncbi:MAG: hypothetical protein LBQ79_11405 [Deltaproteobacteria bacterium]|jgi:hypothetical protein|nr:hypothetical protein [Deltaproteobacteria bacterium]